VCVYMCVCICVCVYVCVYMCVYIARLEEASQFALVCMFIYTWGVHTMTR